MSSSFEWWEISETNVENVCFILRCFLRELIGQKMLEIALCELTLKKLNRLYT